MTRRESYLIDNAAKEGRAHPYNVVVGFKTSHYKEDSVYGPGLLSPKQIIAACKRAGVELNIDCADHSTMELEERSANGNGLISVSLWNSPTEYRNAAVIGYNLDFFDDAGLMDINQKTARGRDGVEINGTCLSPDPKTLQSVLALVSDLAGSYLRAHLAAERASVRAGTRTRPAGQERHQRHGVGVRVGDQLDGVGVRGFEGPNYDRD